jgi:hypothetical protein
MRRLLPLILISLLAACNLSGDDDDPTATPALTDDPVLITPPATRTLIPTSEEGIPTNFLTPTLPVNVTVRLEPTQPPVNPIINPTAVPGPGVIVGTPVPAPADPEFPTDYRDRYTVTARAGDVLVVDYTITLSRPADVYLSVYDPAGAFVGGILINQTSDDELLIDAEISGEYEVRISFDTLPGNYNVSFSTR